MTSPEPSADSALPDRRAAVVYNPVKVDAVRLRGSVEQHAARAGWAEPVFLPTTVDDPGQGLTRRALDAGAAVVMVAGGDGTVRAVAEAMRGSGVPLAILPSGTGNLLARNLRLPMERPDDMVRAAFDGDTAQVDIGVARVLRRDRSTEEHAFVVMAGMGLDAAMIARTRPQLKRSMGWIAYVDGAARSLPGATPFRIVYQLDDDQRLRSAKVQSILFANCGALPAGIDLIPDASIADGLLDLAVIQPSGPFGWLGVWRKVWWDNSVLRRFRAGRYVLQRRGRDASIRYLRGTAVETATPDPQPIELDGDGFGEAVRIFCRVEKGGLTAVVPRGHRVKGL